MINLKTVAQGLEKARHNSFNTDLFIGDRESLEQFDKTEYSLYYLVSTDHKHDRGEHDKFVETLVAIGQESDFYLVTATTTDFNGETQVSFTQQEMTLQGLNYFTKDMEEGIDNEIYDNYLVSKGYEFTLDDVKELGELKPDLSNCIILSFEDDKDNKHFITVNSKNQLSRITVKEQGRKVNTSNFKSAFN